MGWLGRLGRVSAVAALLWVGCSNGDAGGGGRGGGNGAAAGAGAAGDAAAGSSAGTGFGNSGTPPTPTGGLPATGGAGAPATGGSGGAAGAMPPTPTSGVEPALIDNCPGSLSQADVDALQAGGSVDASMRFLYPYDGTVFPRGLEPPLLQWDAASTGTDAVYVHMTSAQYELKLCLGSTAIGQATIPRDAWDAAFKANEGVRDPLVVEVTTLGGGVVSGPIHLELTLARATLKGAIYYNTYASPKAVSQGWLNGVVMRVTPGQNEPDVFVTAQTPSLGDICVGCHSVSADGTRMVVEEHAGAGIAYNTSLAYGLQANQSPLPPVMSQLGNSKAAFSAMYPDGSRFLTTGRPEAGPFSTGQAVNGTFGIETSALWDTDSGNEIPNTGIPQYARMPMFNPDGTMVVFNDLDLGDALAVMDFDPATNQFSNHRMIADDSLFMGWPFFLPDNSGVVFAVTDQPGYTTMAGADLTGLLPNNGELRIVHLESGAETPLARAMGYTDTSLTTSYLPYGDRDMRKDYIPTVSPVAAGGYFWVFFTSKRNYGNVKNLPVPTVDSKQIWVSAISIPGTNPDFDAAQGKDPSHPAFWLPGQEEESGNIRAFATLNPCKADGDSCETGIDCCTGFCTDGVCGRPPTPPEDPPRCSEIDEACTTVSDCCDAGKPTVDCIAGFCAYIPVLE